MKSEFIGRYVIVRTQLAGVHAGILLEKKGTEVRLQGARRLWRWYGAASLSQLAMEGVKKPAECKFPCEVDKLEIMGVIEVLPCSPQSIESIKGVPVWTA